MCADIQDSRAVFKFAPYPKEWFKSRYPDDYDKLKPDANTIMPQSDAHLGRGNDERILMIECWEREYDKQTGRFRVHMARLAGRRMLEDSRIVKPEGYYAHGEYPFVITALFPRKGTALGYGYVDMFATQQLYADKIDQIVLKNALMASHNKLLITGASGLTPPIWRTGQRKCIRGQPFGHNLVPDRAAARVHNPVCRGHTPKHKGGIRLQ